METREIFSYSISKVNKNRLLLINKYELDITICIIKDNQKQFSIEKRKFHIFKEQINKIIKKYHNRLL